jgi:mRNA interferase HigB
MSPPQLGQSSGNSSPTRAISFAQAIRDESYDRGFACGVLQPSAACPPTACPSVVAAARADPVGGFVPGPHVKDAGNAAVSAADHGEPVECKSEAEHSISAGVLGADRRHAVGDGRARSGRWLSSRRPRALSAWYKIASKAEWANLTGLKRTFGPADQVGNCVVFDIGNNRYRLIGRVFYPRKLYVLRVMDHEEYDRVPWASQCGCHSPPPKRRTPPTKRPGGVRRRRR